MTILRPYLLKIFKRDIISKETFTEVQKRFSSYYSSKFLVDVDINTRYEKTQNPEEWKFVERVLPPAVVPEPQRLPEYKSGWKPPSEDLSNKPYYIPRTKNHMMPVYLRIMQRGIKRHTILKKIQGNIWQLEKDLRPFLEEVVKPRPLRMQVNEFAGRIVINGDHVNAIKYWLSERNY